jgi:hypothetical protein
VWLGHSATLHSHATLHPHFCSPGLCFAKPLFGLQKRRKQPERYAPFVLKFFEKYSKKTLTEENSLIYYKEMPSYDGVL